MADGTFQAVGGLAEAPAAGRKSVLLIGSCNLHELVTPLRSRLNATQCWRRPTIALMAPALPRAAIGPIDAAPEVERYILSDLRKSHLAAIRRARPDVLVFELLREILTSVVRLGDSWIANPCELIGLPGGASIAPAPEGPAPTLGLAAAPDILSFRDDGFLDVWRSAFAQFRDQVIEPRLREGGRVILYEGSFTKSSFGVAGPWIPEDGHADRANAVLAEMTAEALRTPGIEVLAIPEALRVTAPDVTWGGPYYTHYIHEAYAFGSDQLAAMVLGADAGAAASIAASLRRAQAQLEGVLALQGVTAERDAAQAATAALHAERDSATAALHADLASARAARAEAEVVRSELQAALAAALLACDASQSEARAVQAELAATTSAQAATAASLAETAANLTSRTAERDALLAEAAALRTRLERATTALATTEQTMAQVARSLLLLTEERVALRAPADRSLLPRLRIALLGQGRAGRGTPTRSLPQS